MMATLTANAISALNSGVVDIRPMVQVLDIRQIASAQSVQDRYRMMLSDGSFMQQAMLATQLNQCVKSGRVKKGSVVQLIEYLCNSVQNRKIIIVLNMDVVVVKCEIVGHPKQLIYSTQQQQRTSMPMQQAPEFQPAQHLQPGHIKEPETSKEKHVRTQLFQEEGTSSMELTELEQIIGSIEANLQDQQSLQVMAIKQLGRLKGKLKISGSKSVSTEMEIDEPAQETEGKELVTRRYISVDPRAVIQKQVEGSSMMVLKQPAVEIDLACVSFQQLQEYIVMLTEEMTARHSDLRKVYIDLQQVHAKTVAEHSSLTAAIEDLHLGLRPEETLSTTTEEKCEDIKELIEDLKAQNETLKEQMSQTETPEQVELKQQITQAEEVFDKTKSAVQNLSKLINTIFTIWGHLQDVPEVAEKEAQVKFWEEEVKTKKQSLQVLSMSARMEAMKDISNLTKKINTMKTEQQQVATQVMELQEKANTQYVNITQVYEKSQKAVELGEAMRPSQQSTKEEVVKFQNDFEVLLQSVEQLDSQFVEFAAQLKQVFPSVVKAEKNLDYSSESKFLLDQIDKLSRGEFNNTPAIPTTNMGTYAGYGNTGYVSNSLGSNSNMNFGGNGMGANQGGGYFDNMGGYGGVPNGRSNMNSASDSCYKCGKGGHFARECPIGTGEYFGGSLGGGYGNSGTNMGSTSCYKCGQGGHRGHWARDCPTSTRTPAYGAGSAAVG